MLPIYNMLEEYPQTLYENSKNGLYKSNFKNLNLVLPDLSTKMGQKALIQCLKNVPALWVNIFAPNRVRSFLFECDFKPGLSLLD